MQKKFNWKGYSNANRNNIIQEVQKIISDHDGCIMNFNLFSDLALSLNIEIEEYRILGLKKALEKILKVDGEETENVNSESKKDCLIFLNLSFGKGSGNLKMEIPEVPG